MPEVSVWIYAIASVFIVSLISLIGISTLSVKPEKLKGVLIYLVSLSAGALLGGAFLHLLPDLVKEVGFTVQTSLLLLGGIVLFFVTEKIFHWQHCHVPPSKEHVHTFAKMNLIGDGFHNFLDGLIIGGAYLINIPAGIVATIAVALHEVPQEIGDFGVLLQGGFSRVKALTLNFLSALIAVVGLLTALLLGSFVENIQTFIVPIAVGGFIYIAGSDLIPELHRHSHSAKKSFLQLLAFLAGILIMFGLLFLEI